MLSYNNFLSRFLSLLFVATLPLIVWSINPSDPSFGSEYTAECVQINNDLWVAFSQKNVSMADELYKHVISRVSDFSVLERAKYLSKLYEYELKKVREMEETVKNWPTSKSEAMYKCMRDSIFTLNSYKTVKVLRKESEDYCYTLWKEHKDQKNKVDIDASDRTIQYFMCINPEKWIAGIPFDTSDLRSSGEILVTSGGVFKAITDAQGWHRIISYNRKEAVPGWIKVCLRQYYWPNFEQGQERVVFIKSSDNP